MVKTTFPFNFDVGGRKNHGFFEFLGFWVVLMEHFHLFFSRAQVASWFLGAFVFAVAFPFDQIE